MPSSDFILKVGDTVPSVSTTLTDSNDDPVDLTNATVNFHLASDPYGEDVHIDTQATITDAANGKVAYVWDDTDTTDAGVYYAEFAVTYADGNVQRFPNDDHLSVEIVPSIA